MQESKHCLLVIPVRYLPTCILWLNPLQFAFMTWKGFTGNVLYCHTLELKRMRPESRKALGTVSNIRLYQVSLWSIVIYVMTLTLLDFVVQHKLNALLNHNATAKKARIQRAQNDFFTFWQVQSRLQLSNLRTLWNRSQLRAVSFLVPF